MARLAQRPKVRDFITAAELQSYAVIHLAIVVINHAAAHTAAATIPAIGLPPGYRVRMPANAGGVVFRRLNAAHICHG
ncbi:hypothetical protein ACJVQT_22860 [Enterobacter huaxiensis]|uniref:hypothetical protein n=1 Tax=Enterobacter huaxiensis TaxID=2494702 RepID=UPI0035C1584D